MALCSPLCEIVFFEDIIHFFAWFSHILCRSHYGVLSAYFKLGFEFCAARPSFLSLGGIIA